MVCAICYYYFARRYYGRPLSVAWAKSMLYFANVYLFLFLWPPYSPSLVNGGSRKFYTWWPLSVNWEVTTWIFFLVILKLQGGRKKWRNLAYFQTTPANFLLSRPNAAEYCNSEKNLLSTDGCSTVMPRLVNFGLQTPEIHAPQNS